jgi:hypothetical protein
MKDAGFGVTCERAPGVTLSRGAAVVVRGVAARWAERSPGDDIPAKRHLWILGGASVILAALAIGSESLSAQPGVRSSPLQIARAVSSGACAGRAKDVPGGPDGSGRCWPGPDNTGVPAGTTLTDYTGQESEPGVCTITTPNTTIDRKIVNCILVIRAANVTITNSKLNTRVLLDVDDPESRSWSLTIQDSEVDGGQKQLQAIGWGNLKVIRSNIHGGQNAVQCEKNSLSCLVEDSYLHGQYIPPDADWHLDGFLSDGGQNMTLRHNYVVCDPPVNSVGGGCTADIAFNPDFAPINGALVERNLLGASPSSAYCTYGGEKPSSPTPHSFNVVYRDNVFQRGPSGKCGVQGPATEFLLANTGNVWTCNTWDTGGLVDPPPPNPRGSRETCDIDRDGLTDVAELRRYHTDPRWQDSDADGLTDGSEVTRYHTSPRRNDTDRDGLSDILEIRRYHTDPRKRDTDGDGLTDAAEIRKYHTSPRKRDTDGDGSPDRVEIRAGTNPLSRRSTPGRNG